MFWHCRCVCGMGTTRLDKVDMDWTPKVPVPRPQSQIAKKKANIPKPKVWESEEDMLEAPKYSNHVSASRKRAISFASSRNSCDLPLEHLLNYESDATVTSSETKAGTVPQEKVPSNRQTVTTKFVHHQGSLIDREDENYTDDAEMEWTTVERASKPVLKPATISPNAQREKKQIAALASSRKEEVGKTRKNSNSNSDSDGQRKRQKKTSPVVRLKTPSPRYRRSNYATKTSENAKKAELEYVAAHLEKSRPSIPVQPLILIKNIPRAPILTPYPAKVEEVKPTPQPTESYEESQMKYVVASSPKQMKFIKQISCWSPFVGQDFDLGVLLLANAYLPGLI